MELPANTLIPCSDLEEIEIGGLKYMRVKNKICVMSVTEMEAFNEEEEIIIEHEVITVNDGVSTPENEGADLSQRDFFEGCEEERDLDDAVHSIFNDSEGIIIDSEDECIEGTPPPRKRRRVEEEDSGIENDLTASDAVEEKDSGIENSPSEAQSVEQEVIEGIEGVAESPEPEDVNDESQFINNYLFDCEDVSSQVAARFAEYFNSSQWVADFDEAQPLDYCIPENSSKSEDDEETPEMITVGPSGICCPMIKKIARMTRCNKGKCVCHENKPTNCQCKRV